MLLPFKRLLAPLVALVLLLAASSATAQEPVDQGPGPGGGEAAPAAAPGSGTGTKPPAVRDSRVKLRVKGLRGGRLTVGKRFKVAGTLAPYEKGERVTLIVRRGKKTIQRKVVTPKRKQGSNFSKFEISGKQIRPGRYSVQAIHKRSKQLTYDQERTKGFKIRYPGLRKGNRNSVVKIFNNLLARQGYVNDKGKKFDNATARAVLAFRKVNGMSWKTKATGKMFKKLADGRGGYKVKHPGSGKHVEVDISRQIMVLAKGKKAKEIYHVSTGASATPTIPGTWRFYRKEPGFNNKEMYYSVYYNRGYAIHGYKSVPTYPASHGCTRNPIPNSVHIYNWVDIGMLIHVSR